jgi:hypothetical protein
MGFSKKSENQTNKGGLLRQVGLMRPDKPGERTSTEASEDRTRMDKKETRINKRSGGKRRARKKRRGKTT